MGDPTRGPVGPGPDSPAAEPDRKPTDAELAKEEKDNATKEVWHRHAGGGPDDNYDHSHIGGGGDHRHPVPDGDPTANYAGAVDEPGAVEKGRPVEVRDNETPQSRVPGAVESDENDADNTGSAAPPARSSRADKATRVAPHVHEGDEGASTPPPKVSGSSNPSPRAEPDKPEDRPLSSGGVTGASNPPVAPR